MKTEPMVAVIAGVGSGIGAALARKFAREGCAVALIARSTSFSNHLAEELKRSGTRAIAVEADIGEPEQVAVSFAQIREQLGEVDVLINHASAGGPGQRSIVDLTAEAFENSWRVSALGGLLCTKEVVQDMLKNGSGVIVFTGATSSVRGSAIAFSSAKFAVRGLAQSLARELWPKGIHVAHVLIDGVVHDPGSGQTYESIVNREAIMNPPAIADAYWNLIKQDRSSWTLELDLRPFNESFFE
jgi:NAD(P)-dependent dehydrogenase (short-subunit alcohol dehydrogenase family)